MLPPVQPVIAALTGATADRERVATARMLAELKSFFMVG
jgi:hypothetical protein